MNTKIRYINNLALTLIKLIQKSWAEHEHDTAAKISACLGCYVIISLGRRAGAHSENT